MKRAFLYFILLLLAVVGIVLARLNAGGVDFHFYLSSVNAPLAVLLYGALAAGAVAGVLISLGMVWRARREAARLRKRLALCEKEIQNLRQIPIKEKY
ncbi:MAG: lipopolysaccharide assembly protein LapA domain-containing protein [Pseudomonadota bacterium]